MLRAALGLFATAAVLSAVRVVVPAGTLAYQNAGGASGVTETTESTVTERTPTDDGYVTTVTTTDASGNTSVTQTTMSRVQNGDGSDTVTETVKAPDGATTSTAITRRGNDGPETVVETATDASGRQISRTTTTTTTAETRNGTTTTVQQTDSSGKTVTTTTAKDNVTGSTTVTETVRDSAGATTTTTTETGQNRYGDDVTTETRTTSVPRPDGTAETRTRVTTTTTSADRRRTEPGAPPNSTTTTTVQEGSGAPTTETTVTQTTRTDNGYVTTVTTTDANGGRSVTQTTLSRVQQPDGSDTLTETVRVPDGSTTSSATTRRRDGSTTVVETGTDRSGAETFRRTTTENDDGSSLTTEVGRDSDGNPVTSTTVQRADGSTETTTTVRDPSGAIRTTTTKVEKEEGRDGITTIETTTYPVVRPDGTVEMRTRIRRTLVPYEGSRRRDPFGASSSTTTTTTIDRPATAEEAAPKPPPTLSGAPVSLTSLGSSCAPGDDGCTPVSQCVSASCFDVAAFCADADDLCGAPGSVDPAVQYTFTGSFSEGAGVSQAPGQGARRRAPGGGTVRLARSLLDTLLPVRVRAADPPRVSIVANGASLGQSFEVQVTDPSGVIRTLAVSEGIVLQPVRGQVRPFGSSAPSGNSTVAREIGAYCLDFAKAPPSPGQVFRVAPPDVQRRFTPLRRVLQAVDRVSNTLHPDSDPPSYLNAIRQYALWSRIEGWDQEAFARELVERTKKNAENAGVRWTSAMERAVAAAAPGRWRDIQTVLEEAGPP